MEICILIMLLLVYISTGIIFIYGIIKHKNLNLFDYSEFYYYSSSTFILITIVILIIFLYKISNTLY